MEDKIYLLQLILYIVSMTDCVAFHINVLLGTQLCPSRRKAFEVFNVPNGISIKVAAKSVHCQLR
jgi:hypothetical protein